MSRCSPGSLLFLCFALVPMFACDRGSMEVPTAPTTFQAQPTVQSAFTAQPQTLQTEFLPARPDFTTCLTPAFGTRVIIVVSGGSDLFLNGLRFRFTDRFGISALPLVTPIPGTSPFVVPLTSIPTGSPITAPGIAPLPTAPIPIPQPRQFPFFLSFGCGVGTDGILVVTADTTNGRGLAGTMQMQLRVGNP